MTKKNKGAEPKLENNNELFSYDEFPYDSLPFGFTRPEYLRGIGVLFGMNPPLPENARVLELGSASGGNILNFAQAYPKSYTLGIDLSKKEIEDGNKIIKDLGLKNIELKHLSILDLDESYGKFDYIICHGVFSWVPDIVKDKILEISKKSLTPNGIAFVSYNTLPGWNMAGTVREMMLFHSSIFEDGRSKLNQARLFVDFVKDALEGSSSPYAKFLNDEAKFLSMQNDSYVLHEYLEPENKAMYFNQFISMAAPHGLRYLGETNLHSMFLGNMPPKAVEKLQAVSDIVHVEQYMDFIMNRRFRCTLLCHDNVQLSRNILNETLTKFHTSMYLVPDKKESEININNALDPIDFYFQGMKTNNISTTSPAMKAIFYVYAENVGNPLKTAELLKLAAKKAPNLSMRDLGLEFTNSLGKMFFSGYMRFFLIKPQVIYDISAKPKVSELVRYQVKNWHSGAQWVTTEVNEPLVLKIHEPHIIELLDGKHSVKEIKEKIKEKFVSGVIVANQGEERINDEKTLSDIAEQCVDVSLQNFKINYLLIG